MRKLFDKWVRRRKTRKDSFHSEDQHAGVFPRGIGNLLEEKRKGREIENAKNAALKAAEVTLINLPPVTSSAPAFIVNRLHDPPTATPQNTSLPVPLRASNTLTAMISYTTSLPRVPQQLRQPRKLSPMYYGKDDVFSKITSDLIFYLMDFLDHFSILNLKLSNKRLYATISLNHLPEDTLMELKMKHREQSTSLSGTSILLPKLQIDEAEMEVFQKRREERMKQIHGIDVMICGSCCDFLFQVPGISLKDICRCENPSFSSSDQYTDWCLDRASTSSTPEILTSDGNMPQDVEIPDESAKVSCKNLGWNISRFPRDLGEVTTKPQEKERPAVSTKAIPMIDQHPWLWVLGVPQEWSSSHSETTEMHVAEPIPPPALIATTTIIPDALQDISKSTIQGKPQTIKIVSKTSPRFTGDFAQSGERYQQQLLAAQKTACPKCLKFTRWVPGCVFGIGMCQCVKEEKAKKDAAALSSLDDCGPDWKICPNCRRKKFDSTHLTTSADWGNMCGCKTYTPIKLYVYRKTCQNCLRFTEKQPWPAFNPVEEMCQCSTSPQLKHVPNKTNVSRSLRQNPTIPRSVNTISTYPSMTALVLKATNTPTCLSCKLPIHPTTSGPETQEACWCKCPRFLASPTALNITFSNHLTCITCEGYAKTIPGATSQHDGTWTCELGKTVSL